MDARTTASPYSTGGGGYRYEHMVAAAYLAAMIRGESTPGVDGMVTEVKFQQQGAGHLLDDLVVVFDRDGSAHRLSLQAKSNLPVGMSSDFKSVIADCWQMFAGGEGITFDRSADLLGIVLPRLTRNAHYHYRRVPDMARDSADGATFWGSLKDGGHSKRRLQFAEFVRGAAAGITGSEAADDDVWELLRHLHIIELDMDGPDAAGYANAVEVCRRALYEPGEGEAAKLFDALRGVAADLASTGGSIGPAALRGRLSAFDLGGHERAMADAGRLAAHSRTVMDGVKKTIAGEVALDRASLLEALEEKTKASPVTIIHGEPFAGKSVLARLFAEKRQRAGTAMFFGADYLGNSGSLEAFLHSLGMRGNLDDLLETHGTAPHRYIVVDGFDRLLYEGEKARVAEGLLAAVSRYNAGADASAEGADTSWKIIVTSRNMELEYVTRTVEEWCGGMPATLEVVPLDGEEIGEVRRMLPQMESAIKGRLGGLLSLPGYLDVIARCRSTSLEGMQGAVGEGRLFDLIWNEVVLRRGGLRGGRGHGLDREKVLMDMARRAYAGGPPEGLHGQDRGAVEGLLTDRLVRRIGDRLAFAHDVIEDYALARVIECAETRRPLLEDATRSRRLIRPLRICAAKMLEVGASAASWLSLFKDCRRLANGEVWARECLLGAADSDEARSNLDAIAGALLRNDGRLLAGLLAALPSAFLRDDPRVIQAARDLGADVSGLHPARYKMPRDERFSPVLSFALDNMEHLGGAATTEFIKAAAKWAPNGADRSLKRRIAEYAARHMDWLHRYDAILGQDYGKSDKTKALVAATLLYSSGPAPDLVEGFISTNPTIVHNRHFKRGLIQEYGWMHLCAFLPSVAVDVLSRIMCSGPDDSGFLEGVPGIRDDGWTDLASPREGPFHRFLETSSDHGLELVHRVLNHATEQWRRAQEAGRPLPPPRTPLPQTVRLESGPVEVYGDEYVFAWCGHARRAPDLVVSALMALELWLDGQIERGEEPVAALLDRVLRATRSAAVVGVCCTVALRHMDKSAEAVLPMLSNPAFWIMDLRRCQEDKQAGSLIRMQAMLAGGGPVMKEKYESAMRRAGTRAMLSHLGAFVVQLLFGGPGAARLQMQEALREFPDRVPVFYKDEIGDEKTMKERRRYCEVCSKQAHKDSYTCTPTPAGTVIAFNYKRFRTDDEMEEERQRQAHTKALAFMMWSYNLLEQNKTGPGFTVESALEYAGQMDDDTFFLSLPKYHADSAVNGKANLVGAMMVHRWDEAAKMGVADACLRDFEDMADMIDPRNRDESSYPYGADRAIARALPRYYLRCGRSRSARKAINKFTGAYNPEVLGYLMHGLRSLWGHDDRLVLECIAKVRRRSRGKRDYFGHPYTDWTGYAAALPALHDALPVNGGTERRIRGMVDDMLDDTIAAFKDFEDDRDYGRTYASFHSAWCPGFFRILESHIAGRPELRDDILGKVVTHWELAPPLLESYMRWTIHWSMGAGRKEQLLHIWKKLLPSVIKSKFATRYYRDERTKKSILALLIFADAPKAADDEGRFEVVEGLAAEISLWCVAFAGRKDAVEAVASLLADAPPALLLLRGIGWLWQVLQQADASGLSGATVKMVSQLLYKASTRERPDGVLPDHRAKYAWLVDCLVTLNDPVAESIKDEGKNPYADACERDGR